MSLILVDVDYVTVDLHTEWYGRYNRDWEDNLQIEAVTRWALHEFVKPECGKKIYEYLLEPDLYDNVQITPGAKIALLELRSKGHRCVFVTSGIHRGKYTLLHRHGMVTDESDFIVAKDKSLIKGDYIVDDYEQNIINSESIGILFDAPHNRHFEYPFRAKSWEEVVAYIDMLEEYRLVYDTRQFTGKEETADSLRYKGVPALQYMRGVVRQEYKQVE